MDADYNLERFISAQAPVYPQVLGELQMGRKRTHWMWFIFPQIAGLGQSATAQHFAIASLDEARAYLNHGALGPRLVDCTVRVNAAAPASAYTIFGAPDDLKFRSSMTLFRHAGGGPVFAEALRLFFSSQDDPRTCKLLASNQAK